MTGKHTCTTMLSAALGLILLTFYATSCDGSATQILKRNIAAFMKESYWNERSKRIPSNSVEDIYFESPANSPPSFGNFERNVTVNSGRDADLHCFVNNLGENKVSWIRMEDMTMISHGFSLSVEDPRYEVRYSTSTNDWAIRIKYTQPSDTGAYECQVDSDPKISSVTTLNVIPLKINILEPPEQYVDAGSTIKLTCVMANAVEQPRFASWHHNNKLIYEDDNVDEIGDNKYISVLDIEGARKHHSGNYTCGVLYAESASAFVHVSNDTITEPPPIPAWSVY